MKDSYAFVFAGNLLFAAAVTLSHGAEQWAPTIPKTWDDALIASLEVPLSEPGHSPKHITANYY